LRKVESLGDQFGQHGADIDVGLGQCGEFLDGVRVGAVPVDDRLDFQ
jgi:hypothetical protein